MKATADCFVCLLRQALNTSRFATPDPRLQREIVNRAAALIPGARLNQTPAALSQPVYEIVSAVTGIRDPYRARKRADNREAMALLPDLRRQIRRSPDPLDTALHVAAAGNMIDLGIGHRYDLRKDLRRMLRQPFAINAIDAFRRELKPGRRLLYLADNSGEIAFDRLLIEHLVALGLSVTVSVKSGPIINDATRLDAGQVGLTDIVPVIETGGADIGVNWRNISREFRLAVRRADVIVAKGHGNFETCNDRPENFYFLLKAKCDIVAAELGIRLGDLAFKHASRRRRR